MKIQKVLGREVIDSRGNPTVEVEVHLSDGASGRAIVPSGASTGEHEVLELRDGDPKRYLGKGTLKAVANVNQTFADALTGKVFSNVRDLDSVLLQIDGTSQKSKLGANAILGISMAFTHAVAQSQKRPLYAVINEWMEVPKDQMKLPVPLMNVINGGAHANNSLEIQEFMIVPHGFDRFSEALRAGCEIFQHLKKALAKKGCSTAVGDEGGFAPELANNEEALALLCDSIATAGYEPGTQISLSLDCAASEFFNKETRRYELPLGGSSNVGASEVIDFYEKLAEKYPIYSIEDGLDENDWPGWKTLTEKLGNKIQLVGDDLFVTNKTFVQRGIQENVANSVLVKVNQIGSLSETFDTMKLCRQNNYKTIVSHRSGETEDVTIAHLAVASGSGQIKTGSLSRGERTAKYNELLRIESSLA